MPQILQNIVSPYDDRACKNGLVDHFSEWAILPRWPQGRHGSVDNEAYRYGFNGMETDDEIKRDGNSYDFGARMYDNRIGRFFAIDDYAVYFPNSSPYAYSVNNPIIFKDRNGDFPWPAVYGAIIGASSEFAFQVFDSMLIEGATLEEAIDKVNYKMVAWEATKGGVMANLPFNTYAAKRISRLFDGKYRQLTFYLVKESLEMVQDILNEAFEQYIKDEAIDLEEALRNVLEGKLVDEIFASETFVPKILNKKGEKIRNKIEKSVDKYKKARKLRKKFKKAKGKKRKRLKKRMNRQLKKAKDLQNQAEKLMVEQYNEMTNFQEMVKDEFANRAKAKVQDEIDSQLNVVLEVGNIKQTAVEETNTKQ